MAEGTGKNIFFGVLGVAIAIAVVYLILHLTKGDIAKRKWDKIKKWGENRNFVKSKVETWQGRNPSKKYANAASVKRAQDAARVIIEARGVLTDNEGQAVSAFKTLQSKVEIWLTNEAYLKIRKKIRDNALAMAVPVPVGMEWKKLPAASIMAFTEEFVGAEDLGEIGVYLQKLPDVSSVQPDLSGAGSGFGSATGNDE